VDAGFTLSLLARGSVPGGTAAAAQQKYARARESDPRYVYHGRVVRENGWICLHYMFFHFMNDYRSTFNGVNDHEADWEQVFIYLEDAPTGVQPVWIAAAAHDYSGDELRRRWDDPTLQKQGEHPIINAGAGSHASYFEAGEYLTEVPIPALRGLGSFLDVVRDFWRKTLRQPDPGDLRATLSVALSVPFVDYARGDGLVIGPGQGETWSPVLIDDSTDWVDGYRGLFGLDTFDRLAGERAPAGPKYGRTGTVRQSWNDPLGFAGLGKMAPPFRQPQEIERRIEELEAEAAGISARVGELATQLPGRTIEVRALGESGSTIDLYAAQTDVLEAEEQELGDLRARQASIADTVEVLRRERVAIESGDFGDPQRHLQQPHRPAPPEEARDSVIIEVWSAVSAGVLLFVIAGLVFFRLVPWWAAFLVGIFGYIIIEAALRRRLTTLLLRSVLVLATFLAVLLIYDFRMELVLVGVAGLALVVVADNVREVSRS